MHLTKLRQQLVINHLRPLESKWNWKPQVLVEWDMNHANNVCLIQFGFTVTFPFHHLFWQIHKVKCVWFPLISQHVCVESSLTIKRKMANVKLERGTTTKPESPNGIEPKHSAIGRFVFRIARSWLLFPRGFRFFFITRVASTTSKSLSLVHVLHGKLYNTLIMSSRCFAEDGNESKCITHVPCTFFLELI